jgi:hypothetical protein
MTRRTPADHQTSTTGGTTHTVRDDTVTDRPPVTLAPVPDDPGPTTVHYDQPAELAILGAILLEPQRATKLADHLEPADFYQPRHETIWTAIHDVNAQGILPDVIVVAQHLQDQGTLNRVGGGLYLHRLMESCPTPLNAEYYAESVRNAARIRTVGAATAKLQHLVNTATPDTLDLVLSESMQTIDDVAIRVGPAHKTVVRVPNITEILSGEDDDTYDWVIPGLIEHQERVILTAEEGAGKSTLLRQIGITAASGIHPFSGEQIPPVTVLHIDVENSLRQSRRRYRPLRIQAGDALNPDLLRVELKVAGLDLTQTPDRDWLLQITQSIKPDLLLIGPIYKLANGDPTEEKSAKPVAMILDQVRDLTDCALILEAHVAKAPSGQKKRPHEPYGWSGWLRWPELGIFMDKDGTLKHWRGAREEREWPEKLERGGHWPWSAALTGPDEAWIAIQKARKDAKRPVSLRDLEQMTGFSKSTLGRLVGPTGKYAHGWPGYNNSNLISDRRDGS